MSLKLKPSGIGGWLLLLVFSLGASPILFLGGYAELSLLSRRLPEIEGVPGWSSFRLLTLASLFVVTLMNTYGAYLLCMRRQRSTIGVVQSILWLTGPTAVLVIGIFVPAITLEGKFLNPASVLGYIITTAGAAAIWTAYLARSRRVQNTYFDEASIPEIARAAAAGDIEQLKILLRNGGDPNTTTPGGHTLLMLAVANGNDEAARILLRSGADPSLTSPAGKTAVEYVKGATDRELIQLLRSELSEVERNRVSVSNDRDHDHLLDALPSAGSEDPPRKEREKPTKSTTLLESTNTTASMPGLKRAWQGYARLFVVLWIVYTLTILAGAAYRKGFTDFVAGFVAGIVQEPIVILIPTTLSLLSMSAWRWALEFELRGSSTLPVLAKYGVLLACILTVAALWVVFTGAYVDEPMLVVFLPMILVGLLLPIVSWTVGWVKRGFSA